LSEYLADLRQPVTPQNRYNPKNVRVGSSPTLGALRSTVFPTILRSRGITNKEISFALLDWRQSIYICRTGETYSVANKISNSVVDDINTGTAIKEDIIYEGFLKGH
jgi:hypothetical protein